MTTWLQGFVYRVDISWWMLSLAAVTVLCIAMLTVGWKALKAARKDPVIVLKAE
jgi:ABC-type antimicrobial peptide transport system permease subunit